MLQFQSILKGNIIKCLIPVDEVAHVQTDNPLEHALLVLVKTGYSAIPVLDRKYRLKGIISKTIILDSILGLERFEFDDLRKYKVEDVMNANPPILRIDHTFQDALKFCIHHNFLCIENRNGEFMGILTRGSILKYVNCLLTLQKHSVLIPSDSEPLAE
ncbi:CBS domain-containing protein [Terrilactibacillus sp. BCM23-1]|uniref:CBS domain-containing protein n=1 Tax=Terrilactibacillus tamarindi TaxID=2599694 RepID=A0A6N8CQN3_9BACI|nr:cyclic-di-AMP-binding protein CbpB [Terrilactibacillus tamarindi]MTT31968.1 CBS domain-containing protein [Terrilactibacillus tamarindi]